ncbi:radical SAM protein [Candidatus Vidania fulgoroideorum]
MIVLKKKKVTILIMGNNCTRNCKFCNLKGIIMKRINNNKDLNYITQVLKKKKINQFTVTSVTRFDIMDNGIFYFANFICKISKIKNPEILITDFGKYYKDFIRIISRVKIKKFCINIETVKRLYLTVKPGFLYKNFFKVVNFARKFIKVGFKTGMMLGLGEKKKEVLNLIFNLSFLFENIVIGQYLSHKNKFHKYISINTFRIYLFFARLCFYKEIKSYPMARSSI